MANGSRGWSWRRCDAAPCLPCRFVLQREKHFHYLKRGLRQLSEAYEVPGTAPAFCPGAPRLGDAFSLRVLL